MTKFEILVHFFWPCHLIVIKYAMIPFTFWTYGHGLIFTTEAELLKIESKILGFILEQLKY